MPAARILRCVIAAFAFYGFTAAGAFAQPAQPAQQGQQAGGLTDPQIADIAYSAGQIDIANARLALRKSHNAAIRRFAQEMIREHTAVNRKAVALLKKLHVTPQNNPTAEALAKQSAQVRTKLARMSGAAFNKAYIDNEVAYHKTVNNALRTELIPATQNPQLKSLLETGLKIFEGHEQHAEAIASKMK